MKKLLSLFTASLICAYSMSQNNNNPIQINEAKDLIEAYSSTDLTILTSQSESFPNVIGESMSCSTPCLSFDVGDCKRLIGENGWVTRKNNLYELVEIIIP